MRESEKGGVEQGGERRMKREIGEAAERKR